MWSLAKHRSRRRGVPFAITVEDVEAAWPVDGRCPVLGVVMQQKTWSAPSLDRLNNEWGYEPGNIAVISRRANVIKSTATARELETIAAWMRSRGLS